MPTPAEAVVRAHGRQMGRLRAATERGVGAAWDRLGSWNRRDVSRFVDLAVPMVAAAQTQAAAITEAYLLQLAGVVAGKTVLPKGISAKDVTGAAVRNGTPPETVYERPFVSHWKALSDGHPWVEAIEMGRSRATGAAFMDVSLAGRQAARQTMLVHEDLDIVGYRRVLVGRSCRFCAVASTQRYHIEDLMPLHPACNCDVVPIWGVEDPGRILNDTLYAKVRQDSPEGFMGMVLGPHKDRKDWDQFGFVDEDGNPVEMSAKETREAIRKANADVVVREHGELGPTLASDKHQFTGSDDIENAVRKGSKADGNPVRLSGRGGGGSGDGPR